MSDRIDELVEMLIAGNDAAHELATLAREAEALCEYLAGEIAMARDDEVDNVLDAAREAVRKEGIR